MILQPNIRYVALQLTGLEPVEVRCRFLPYTTKSTRPKHPRLVWLYLKIPGVQRFFGQQSLIVGRRP